ncbi:hypothetical protein [Sinorhizobium fredii]|uniref:hypothetical protein n=1 Tax=Rhizobium fredii TaxID=380 RepID=UPI0035162FA1
MNQNVLLTIAASVGLVAGVGGTWFATSTSSKEVEVVSKEVIAAFIKADPSLCPVPEQAAAPRSTSTNLEIPSADEANTAFRKAKRSFPSATLAIGQCQTNTMGPGVSCAVDITWKPGRDAQSGVVGFAKTPTGWQAMHYY